MPGKVIRMGMGNKCPTTWLGRVQPQVGFRDVEPARIHHIDRFSRANFLVSITHVLCPIRLVIILASASPRRHELLRDAGIDFDVVVSTAEEIHDHDMPAALLCEENAAIKAREVAERHPDAAVIGADTLVFLDGRALGKPADIDEARAMLRTLSGRTHFVCTGVCIAGPGSREIRFHEITEVTFRRLGDTEISHYISLVHTLDKAGAYGIQDHGDLIIEGIGGGSFENVMGLPVARLVGELSRHGIHFSLVPSNPRMSSNIR